MPATVSIKITQFGVDFSEQACLDNVRRLAAKATATGSRVEIDMESSIYTDRTLDIATPRELAGVPITVCVSLRDPSVSVAEQKPTSSA